MRNRKNGYKVLPVLAMFLIVCVAAACGNGNNETYFSGNSSRSTRTIVFPERFEHLSSMNEERLADYFRGKGEDHYSGLSVEDGLLELSVTEEQAEYWKTFAAEQAGAQESILTAVSPKYRAECNEKHDIISVYYDSMMPFDNAFGYVGRTAAFCAMYQLFDGAEDFSISLNVYNSDTGKLVTGGNLEQDDVSYDNTEWRASYTLDAAEAEKLAASGDADTEASDYDVIKIKSAFTDGMTVIDILQTAGGNDYRYLYLDGDNAVVMAVDETQKEALIRRFSQYLAGIKTQFEKLGAGYEMTWNDGFSALDLKFDANLSKQEQTNYFLYSESLCMLTQLLKGNGDPHYIDIRIFDSSTGELVSNGNTTDGVTWNIGK